ncbi:sce7726 family protein [Xenophilus aerolatus]
MASSALGKPLKTRDRDVRALVLSTVLAQHATDPFARVVEEMGLEHGTCRVDIAVVNGFIHGYELKSEADTLDRLPRQIEAYSRCLDRATLVLGSSHLDPAEKLLPSWWGIKVVERKKGGVLKLSTHRPVRSNPDVSLFHMSHLLWRSEAVEVLRKAGAAPRELAANRATLYGLLVQSLQPTDLRRAIREALKSRANWRRPSPPL